MNKPDRRDVRSTVEGILEGEQCLAELFGAGIDMDRYMEGFLAFCCLGDSDYFCPFIFRVQSKFKRNENNLICDFMSKRKFDANTNPINHANEPMSLGATNGFYLLVLLLGELTCKFSWFPRGNQA